METPLVVLQKYWKFNSFRSPQLEIINSVLSGEDIFVLLPTGGGKSLCFQVPALVMDGICLVISPLVALMRDQVQNLQNKGIKAIALTGGISQDEIIDLLDNCQFGNYKFLYLSPERLQSDWILERIKGLPINSIAIDEAHCISQWGHDFRPAYLKISKLKEFFTKIPFIALTASATSRVQEDILMQLQLIKPALFTASFARKNLAYMIYETEDKLHLMEQILKKNHQPSIIYVSNRKSCTDIVSNLQNLGFTATYYHGGLAAKVKSNQMQLWMDEKVQIMVATNAFGMGIDKPNVKTVLHLHLPQNLENYYQEAGRAGRNGEKAFAVLITNSSDIGNAQHQFLSILPDKAFLNLVYLKLCTFFQIAYGEGIESQHTFSLNAFCLKYNFNTLKVYNAIQFLDRQGIVTLSQEFSEKIFVQFLIESKEVIRYISLNPADEPIVLALVRTYSGIYEAQTNINISLLAKKSNTDENQILSLLQKLKNNGTIEYIAKNNDATIIFNEVREDKHTINRVVKYLEIQNQLKVKQLKSVLYYVSEKNTCRSQLLTRYFGETIASSCGICSSCISKKKTKSNPKEVNEKILELLQISPLSSREIQKQTKLSKDNIIFALQDLLEQNAINIQDNNLYALN